MHCTVRIVNMLLISCFTLCSGLQAAVADINERYLGGSTTETADPTPPRNAPAHSSTSSSSSRPPVQSSRPSVQSSRSHTSSSSTSSSRSSSHYRRPAYKSKDKSSSKGGWNLFKKKETSYHPPPSRKPVTKHAITKAGDWDKESYCWALYNFYGELPCDLQFTKGQRIAIITRTATQDDWWEGTVNGKTGIFPANYVSL